MGIRIKKEIGYFITNKELVSIFVGNYKKVIENLDADNENEQVFFADLLNLMSQHKDKRGEKDVFISGYLFREYATAIKAKKVRAYELVAKLMFGDNDKGVFICSIEQHEQKRYDNLVDYYENPMTDKIKYINRPIHPMTGYVYQGGLEHYPNLVKGQVLDGIEAWIAIKTNDAKQKNDPQKHANEVVKGGYFTPVIEPLIYMIAKSAKILKDGVTKEEFEAVFKPVIATTWG